MRRESVYGAKRLLLDERAFIAVIDPLEQTAKLNALEEALNISAIALISMSTDLRGVSHPTGELQLVRGRWRGIESLLLALP